MKALRILEQHNQQRVASIFLLRRSKTAVKCITAQAIVDSAGLCAFGCHQRREAVKGGNVRVYRIL